MPQIGYQFPALPSTVRNYEIEQPTFFAWLLLHEATVKAEVREVVSAVAAMRERGQKEIQQSDLKSILHLDKSAISRRVADALDAGFLKNLEDRKGRPARLVLGNAMPDNVDVLPALEQLVSDPGCAVARLIQGIGHPQPV